MKKNYENYNSRIVLFCIALILLVTPVMAATTQLHIVKYANDGTTILTETTKTYQWLEANLPVLGDGTTHYYHQGPVFIDNADPVIEQELRWNPYENISVQEKDNGAVKGTNLKDICDLVGGMNSGETLKLRASDGFSKTFAYTNVYEYPARQGPMVITWYQDGNYPDGTYTDGMKLVFFADTSTNPWGIHAMGNYDWHESAAPEYWYYYASGAEQYPTTTGLSVKYLSDVLIYSDDPVPPELDTLFDGPVTLVPGETFSKTAYNSGTSYTINTTTPLGALQTAATSAGLTYDVTDKRWSLDQVLLLDNVSTYTKATGKWYVYVNDVYKDGYGNHANGLNVIELVDNDKVEFYFASGITTPSDLTAVKAAATAAVKTVADIQPPGPVMDVLFDGPVTLVPGETFSKTAYNSGTSYTINTTTPLGALQTAATSAGLTYDVTDKRWSLDQVLLLDNVSTYTKATGKWYVYVNDVYKDGYGNHANGLNVIELVDNDKVEFYFASGITTPSDLTAVKAAATAVVKTVADIQPPGPVMDVLFDGPVTLVPGETFSKTAYNSGTGYTINETTPLGALDVAASTAGFTYEVTDKRWSYDQVLLLDNVSTYTKATGKWYAYVNDVYKDGFGNHANGLNVIELVDNDKVEFYFASGISTPSDLTAVKAAATAVVKTVADIQPPGPVMDVLFDGPVTLVPGETFSKTAYNSGTSYTINTTTPLGALQTAATSAGLTYDVTDKRWSYDQVLLLDNVSTYTKATGKWYAYVNDVYKDGFGNHVNGLNVIELVDNDKVEFYFASGITTPSDLTAVKAAATAAVKTVADIQPPGPVMDVLFDGPVTLVLGETFSKTAYNSGTSYTINTTTPLGALQTAATSAGFTYDVTDKRWSLDQVLLLDNVSTYTKATGKWYAYVNDVYKDGFGNHANGLNVIELVDNDKVEFYFASGITTPSDLTAVKAAATAAVKTVVSTGTTPADWTLLVKGAVDQPVTKTFFEEGLACPNSGHQVNWTDGNGDEWSGVPLWLLIAMVDDIDPHTPDHYNFRDDLATLGYQVKITASDGYTITANSADIARDDGWIIANELNGEPLPIEINGKKSWPLHLKGPEVFSGNLIGSIVKIEMLNIPVPSSEWNLKIVGDVTDTISKEEFEEAVACGHTANWTDTNGNVYSGVPLWWLVGVADDEETENHWTFNDTLAATNYTIQVVAKDGFSGNFYSDLIKHSDAYIVANTMNGTPIAGMQQPLQIVGTAVISGKQKVKNISEIRIPSLQTPVPAAGKYNLNLNGKISDSISQTEFEEMTACPHHYREVTVTDTNGNQVVYSGVPLWDLAGWVDDRIPHGSGAFNAAQATAGYTISVQSGTYVRTFPSTDVMWSDNYIVANMKKNVSAGETTFSPFLSDEWPLRIVGPGAPHAMSVSRIDTISLSDFGTPTQTPELMILKYGADGTTVIAEKTVNYTWMQANLPVIGDGTTAYKFEGLTLDPTNLWDPEETYPGGFKVSNVVKGSRVHDLAELVGGMGSGTTITFVASDGFETTLPYSSIYTNPAVQARQGDAIIAWWGDGQYVPKYADGMRLFFTPDGDHVYGHWDMHETLPSQYWRYNFQDGVQYPSSAGLSAKYITTIKVYSSPESDWTLELDGRDIGGVNYTVSKPFLEEAIACQFGADHKATYTDSKGRVWEGMPLWFFAGFVDDADQHSKDAYNETKAQAGYNILITGKDGYNTTIFSKDIIRSSNYLVANSLNDTHIADSDENWPLRFTGDSVNGSMTVKGVSSIKLIRIVVPPAEGQMKVTSTPAGAEIFINGIDTNNVTPYTFTKAPGDYPVYVTLAGYVTPAPVTATVVSSQLTTKDFVLDAVPPADGQLEVTSTPAGAKIFINGIDTNNVTPYTFTKAPGEYSVYVTLSGYVTPATQTKVVTKNAVTTSDFQLNPITTPSITVVSPNGGEIWKRGNAYPITWSYTGSPGSSVSIVLFNGDTQVFTIASSTSTGSGGSGSYTWNIPADKPLSNEYKIRVQSTSQPTVKDLSNNHFSIIADTTPTSSITVVSPNGGEIWKRGNAYPITWSYTGSPGSSVSIVLFNGDTQVFTIASSTSTGSGGSGSYTWNIPADKPLSNEYKIRVQSTSQPTVKDLSNNHFSIVADTTPTSSITVVSPNGGEIWKRGNAYPITWSYTGSPGSSVSIVLFNGDTQVFTIASSTSTGSGGSGSYTWNIPADKPLSNEYKIRVQSTSQPTVKDLSNNHFSIVADTTPTSSITVVSPNGGEIWKRGNAYPITWSYTDNIGSSVRIILLRGDNPVMTIASNTPIGSDGSGSYTWNIPADKPLGNDYRVSIASSSQATIEDKSDKYFTVASTTSDPTTAKGVSPGIYNAGNWYIDYNGDGQFIPSTGDRYIPYGATGWTQLVGDWNGDGTSEIGIYKDGLWYIDYGGSGVIDANTRYYSFGGAGWTPIVGDWNADKKDEIGVYQDGNWYLDYNGNGAWDTEDKNYGFGTTGWTPVVGKWTADGISKIGIYNAGNWYIDYNGDGQFIPSTGDKYIPYGATGWTQLVGDWNGDGTSEIGLFKDGFWYIDYGGSGMIDANTKYYSFGGAGWTPIVGDWNADKKDEIGVNNAGNWYLDYDGNGVWSSGDKNYGFGTTGWMPVIGKWT